MRHWPDWFDEVWATAAVAPFGPVGQRVPWVDRVHSSDHSSVRVEWPHELDGIGQAFAPVREPPSTSAPWTIRVTQSIEARLARAAPFGLNDRNPLGAVPGARSFGYRLRWDPAHRQLSILHPESRRGLWIVGERLPPWDAAAPLRRLLQWVGAEEGVLLTHAGTVVHQGRALLLVGAGEAGKSSTVGIAVRDGLQTVGEDYVLLTDAAVVAPLYATLKLREGSPLYGSRHRDFGADLPAASEPARACVRFDDDCISGPVPVTGLVVMDPHAAPDAAPVSRAHAQRHLAHSTLLQADDDHAWALGALRSRTNNLPCWRLGHCDPARIGPLLRELAT